MTLACENLRFAYSRAGRAVINDLSVRFAPGRLTAIIGANGCGKSTLLRLLLGTLQPLSGRVTLDGVDLKTIAPALRARRLAYVAQRPALNEAFTARRVVQLSRYAFSSPIGPGRDSAASDNHAAVQSALNLTDAQELADRPFGELSAGQQQRVSLARALAQLHRPTPTQSSGILLADEPCSAMDPRHEQHAMRLVRSLCTPSRESHDHPQSTALTTVLVVLHDLSVVARFCDDVLIMNPLGNVITHAPVHEALTPAHLREAFQTGFRIVRESSTTPGGTDPSRILAVVPDDELR
jgi:iron complex transport system ATP-binding protein